MTYRTVVQEIFIAVLLCFTISTFVYQLFKEYRRVCHGCDR